jgi:cell shape-determining protein MreC
MKTGNSPRLGLARWQSPGGLFACGLLIAFFLAAVPPRRLAAFRQVCLAGLRPGAQAARWAWDPLAAKVHAWPATLQSADDLARLRVEIEQLTRRNQNLEAALAAGTASPNKLPSRGELSFDNLVRLRVVRARVLGWQTASLVRQCAILDQGKSAGVLDGAAVVDRAAPVETGAAFSGTAASDEASLAAMALDPKFWLDQGTRGGIDPGQLVLRGSRVWGKVVAAGEWTSSVLPATAAGYRDTVQVLHRTNHGWVPGPRGLLVGLGQPQCVVERIETTHAVAVGDLVVATGWEGLADEPLWYGRVAQVREQPGQAHWEIRVQLAADSYRLQDVFVVRAIVDPRRLVDGFTRTWR